MSHLARASGLARNRMNAREACGSEPLAARAFIRFLANLEARAKWLAARLEPLADH